ncbi:hypothetical protein BCR32DRAFT_239634 [Anaeromyces robustus]|uniref:Uncharacterized protein n=1 Tax=Anaeromyces robustus TaxID=1754192 RepID=A0A1Y1XR41_9FUNG|nr:hypothetical protein BCR32DRAFT_239634 [Anaeromyces robustus]|eukprot:ORX88115.1 hypothetical protein BCR32DRAFT_239634 [Anaeromyces robustus]
MKEYNIHSRYYRLWIPGSDRHLTKNYYSEYVLFSAQVLLNGLTLPYLEKYNEELTNRAIDLFSCLEKLYHILYRRMKYTLSPPYTDLIPIMSDFDKFWLLFEKRLYTCYHNVFHISKIKTTQIMTGFQKFMVKTLVYCIKKNYFTLEMAYEYDPLIIVSLPRLTFVYVIYHLSNPFFFTNFPWFSKERLIDIDKINQTFNLLNKKSIEKLEYYLIHGIPNQNNNNTNKMNNTNNNNNSNKNINETIKKNNSIKKFDSLKSPKLKETINRSVTSENETKPIVITILPVTPTSNENHNNNIDNNNDDDDDNVSICSNITSTSCSSSTSSSNNTNNTINSDDSELIGDILVKKVFKSVCMIVDEFQASESSKKLNSIMKYVFNKSIAKIEKLKEEEEKNEEKKEEKILEKKKFSEITGPELKSSGSILKNNNFHYYNQKVVPTLISNTNSNYAYASTSSNSTSTFHPALP